MSSTQHENYVGVYDNALGFGNKPALLLVDFVQAYFDPACDLYAKPDAALKSALAIREIAHEKAVPVILTNVVYHPSGVNGGVFYKKAKPLRHMREGSPMADWPDALTPRDDELIVSKQYPSAFFGTSLSSTLTALGVDTVIITGLTTSGCIRATCIDACSYGFIPIVVSDACGDRHPAPHDANLFDMNAKYADVVDAQAVTAYLQSLA